MSSLAEKLAGSVFTGASLIATTLTVPTATFELSAPSLTLTATVRGAVAGLSEVEANRTAARAVW